MITIEKIKELIPVHTNLYYIDYNDNLNNNLEIIQKSIHENDYCYIDEFVFDCLDSFESHKYYIDELTNDLIQLGYEENDVVDFIDNNRSEIDDIIYNRDESTPVKDLIRNTENFACFYDLDVYISEYDEYKDKLKQVKKALGIKVKDTTYDDQLRELIINTFYDSSLVIYFYPDPDDLIGNSHTHIKFSNYIVGLIDNMNGSGWYTETPLKHEITLPFLHNRIMIDRCTSYSFVEDVCGMYDDFCDCTEYKFLSKKTSKNKTFKKSKIEKQLEQDSIYQKTYDSGKCTFGDTKFSRHRDTYYKNEYPCGTHCPHCGQFWID